MLKKLVTGCLLAAFVIAPAYSAGAPEKLRRDARTYELSLKGDITGTPTNNVRATVSYSNTTVGGTSWARPFADCTGASALGPVLLHSQEFSVDTTGAYDVTSVQTGFDGFIFVYQNAFNPASANTNCVIGNDDAVAGIGASEIFGVNLTAGTTYFVVTTGFEAGEVGPFTNTITGPGNIMIGPAGPQADLSITKTAPGGVAVGANYTYALTASNAGPIAATAVVVTDVLPAGVNFVSSSCGATNVAGTVTWNVGALANGASQSCTLTVALAGAVCVAVSNTATIDGAEGDPNAGNNSSTSSNGGAPAGNVVADPSFEDGTPNGFWTEASSNFGTPICDATSCGLGTGTGPRTGTFWTWFGGLGTGPEAGSMQQSVTIPTGAAAITFWVEFPLCSNGASDFVQLLIDGTQVWREDSTAARCNTVGYQQVTVPLTAAQANGAAHVVRFESQTIGGGTPSNFFVDDVSIAGPGSPPTCTTAAPGVLGTLNPSLTFGAQAVGGNSQQVLTITNTGTGPLQVTAISAVTPPFVQVAGGTCGAVPFTLAAGANCTVLYRFSPTTAGDFSQSLTITADVGAVTVPLTGRGIVAIPLPALGYASSLLLLTLLGLGSIVALRRVN